MDLEDLTCALLECGSRDIPIIMDIDDDIVYNAIREMTQAELMIKTNMPNIYYECAIIALTKVGIDIDRAEIDCNYCCSGIYIEDTKNIKGKIKELEKLGFTVN